MVINQNGINPKKAVQLLKKDGENFDINTILETGEFFENKIFIDCTTSEELAKSYPDILNKGFSIVAANKKANTMGMDYYNEIHTIVNDSSVNFKYETNVGAGLPVISTIKSLIASGDKIHKIEGVLSGTLSYLFNLFDGKIPFSELVIKAKESEYTEPDPREDLNGMDVARKLMILAREIGVNMEIDDVYIESLLPEKSENCNSVTEFLNHLKKMV